MVQLYTGKNILSFLCILKTNTFFVRQEMFVLILNHMLAVLTCLSVLYKAAHICLSALHFFL